MIDGELSAAFCEPVLLAVSPACPPGGWGVGGGIGGACNFGGDGGLTGTSVEGFSGAGWLALSPFLALADLSP